MNMDGIVILKRGVRRRAKQDRCAIGNEQNCRIKE